MLSYFSPSRKNPPPILPYTPPTNNNVSPLHTMFGESRRKDTIIKDLIKNLKYKVGDVVQTTNSAFREEMGDLQVEKIVDSFGKMGKGEKWPDSDNPFLITVYSDKKQTRFSCTTNYVELKT